VQRRALFVWVLWGALALAVSLAYLLLLVAPIAVHAVYNAGVVLVQL